MAPSKHTSSELILRLRKLIDDAMAVVFDVSDEPGSLALAAETAPTILGLLDNGTTCLSDIQDHYEAVEAEADEAPVSQDPASLDDIGAMISSEVAAQEVLDLGFIALAQLRLARGRLETAIDSQNLLAMVTRADSALTRLRRECIPLEAAIAEFENLEAPMRRWVDLEVSLEIRRVYGNLRRTVNSAGDPSSQEDLTDVLSAFSSRLANLGSNPIYPRLRISDRVQFQTLGRRISTWLSQEGDRDIVAGRRIWADLSTFCQLLAEVNKRQELAEHDRQLLSRIHATLYAASRPPATISLELLEELHNLEGIDDELDGLIHGASRNPADWRSAVVRLWHHLDPDSRSGIGFL